AGRPAGVARRVATGCSDAGFWLLMTGVDPRRRAELPTTPAEVRLIVESRGVDTWREILGSIVADPWGPGSSGLADIARAADLTAAAQAIDRCLDLCRRKTVEHDRLEVAKEIRRLVAVSG